MRRSDCFVLRRTEINGGPRARGLACATMPYSLYYASSPAPLDLTPHDAHTRLVPVHFTTVHDALHAAALVIRGGQYAWLIEGPGVSYRASEIEERCSSILKLMGRPPSA